MKTERLNTNTGLSPQEHGELNDPVWVYPGGAEAKNKRILALREKYKHDSKALQQIDVYDHNPNAYNEKFRQYRDALKSNDEPTAEELYTWFKEHYPDI